MKDQDVEILLAILAGAAIVGLAYEAPHLNTPRDKRALQRLEKAGYIRCGKDGVSLHNDARNILLEKASRIYDIGVILRHSNDIIFSHLAKPGTNADVVRRTRLSPSTVHRAISQMSAAGILAVDSDGVARLAESLVELAVVMRIEKEAAGRPGTGTIYQNHSVEIRAVPPGVPSEGQLTGFSMFHEYGVPYASPWDYYVVCDDPGSINDILAHAVKVAALEGDPGAMAVAITFYLRNRDCLDVVELRRIARSLDAADVWLDVESYVRNRAALKNGHLFLPWEEFLEKCRIYGVEPGHHGRTGPIFGDVGRLLDRPVRMYLLGGENMRMKGIKGSTKDCDMVVPDRNDFDLICGILIQKLGYARMAPTEYADEDRRLRPSDILVCPGRPRMDMFAVDIMGAAVLTEEMERAADHVWCGSLDMGIIRNEHIFLLKAVAGRHGDIHDMALLVRGASSIPGVSYTFDWGVVWNEILRQEEANPLGFPTGMVLDQISDMARHEGIRAPIEKRLVLHVIDQMVLKMSRGGWRPLSWIVANLTGDDVDEKLVRNRVDVLVRRGLLKKMPRGRTVLVCGVERFPLHDMEISPESVQKYLQWRFPHGNPASVRDIRDLTDHMVWRGYHTVGEVDDMVTGAIPNMPVRDGGDVMGPVETIRDILK